MGVTMRPVFFVVVIAIALPGCMTTNVRNDMAGSGQFFETLESDPYQATGKKAEITQRGQACMSRQLQNNAVIVSSTVASNTVPGGQVIVSSDIPNGLIVANQRTTYTGRNLLQYTLQSTVTLEARDGRFKITHTNIGEAQMHAGYAPATGFRRIGTHMGFSDVPRDLLAKLSSQIAGCVRDTAASSNW